MQRALSQEYDVLRYGSVIYLVNCVVTRTEVEVGFAYFEVGTPVQFPLRDALNVKKIIQVFAPQVAYQAKHPIVLGDADSPLILKRTS